MDRPTKQTRNLACRNIAGIPQRRHGHRHRHGLPREDPREEIARIGRRVGQVGVGVRVGVAVGIVECHEYYTATRPNNYLINSARRRRDAIRSTVELCCVGWCELAVNV